jgi:hypothetical protein
MSGAQVDCCRSIPRRERDWHSDCHRVCRTTATMHCQVVACAGRQVVEAPNEILLKMQPEADVSMYTTSTGSRRTFSLNPKAESNVVIKPRAIRETVISTAGGNAALRSHLRPVCEVDASSESPAFRPTTALCLTRRLLSFTDVWTSLLLSPRHRAGNTSDPGPTLHLAIFWSIYSFLTPSTRQRLNNTDIGRSRSHVNPCMAH